jgi:hypothetical protein
MSFAAMVPQDEVAADFPNETTPETPPLGPGQLETTRQFTTKEMSKVGSSPPEATSKNGEIATPEPPETAVAGHTSTAVLHTTHRTVSEVIVPQTQTPAATSVATVSTTQKSNGVSTGAVAGIAIGTCILGAAIALVVAFLIFKRRKRSSTSGLSAYGSTPELVALSKGPTPFVQEISQVSAPNVAAAVTVKRDMDLTDLSKSSDFLAGVLPQTADDQAVRSKVSMLFNQIQQHVENFYRDVHASITPSMESDLTRFGTPGIDMMELLQSASMPTVAIKHALMGYVLRISSPEGDEATLFPGDVTGVGGKKQFGTPGKYPTPSQETYSTLMTSRSLSSIHPVQTPRRPSPHSRPV